MNEIQLIKAGYKWHLNIPIPKLSAYLQSPAMVGADTRFIKLPDGQVAIYIRKN